LETTDDALIDRIAEMKFMNGRFYILNIRVNTIFIFSENGKFINKIFDRGQGPREYIQIDNYEIDPVHNKILITDSFSKRLFIYDENGKQERVIPLNFQRMEIASDGADGFVNCFSRDNKEYKESGMRNYCIHFLDKDGCFVSSQIPVETQKLAMYSMLSIDCHEDGSIYYQPSLSEIIYCIKDKKVFPYYKLHNKSKYRMLSQKERETLSLVIGVRDDFSEKRKNGYIIPYGSIIDTDNHVYTMFKGTNDVHLFYDKKTGRSIVFDSNELSKNDNLFLQHIYCAKGDVFYSTPNYYNMDEVISEMPESKLKKFLQNTDIDDNPEIISFSIKFPEEKQ
jgi:hypothetical protein